MISSCMRYCIFNKETAEGLLATTFSMSVCSNPARAASWHLIVGGSWQWSPANITLSALRMAIQQAASNAWAASSINNVPKRRPFRIRWLLLTSVDAMTWALSNSSALICTSSAVARSRRRLMRLRIPSRSS